MTQADWGFCKSSQGEEVEFVTYLMMYMEEVRITGGLGITATDIPKVHVCAAEKPHS